MKKTLFLAALAGVALVGCVKNEPVAKSDGSPERITFEAPVVNISTRATTSPYDGYPTEIYGNYPKEKDFGVYALYHEGNYDALTSWNGTPQIYMNNVKCTANKSGENETPDYWQPSTDYYWPKNGKLTFAGYAPYRESGVAWNADGFKFENFEVQATEITGSSPTLYSPAGQIDLLYSDPQTDKQKTDMLNEAEKAPYQGITIPFKHALSSILFDVKANGTYTGTTIKLTGITVNNVACKGTFAKDNGASQSGTAITYKWTVDGSVDKKSFQVYKNDTGMQLTTTAQNVNGAIDTADEKYDTEVGDQVQDTPNNQNNGSNVTVKNDGKRRSDLILIPQELTDVTVTIDYTIQNGTGPVLKQSSKFQMATKGNENTSPTKMTSWEMGKRYLCHIVIGLDKIYFNPQVTNWTDVQTDFIEVQNN